MWKTRFEVNTSNSNGMTRRRNLSTSSKIIHHHYSGRSPTVPRVREDSPSAVVRPSPPSSMPNLEILTEEDEDIPCSDERPSSVSTRLHKQNSYQTVNKYQIILPTIIESNDHEQNENDINILSNESIDDKYNKYIVKLKRQDSFVGTNTNYNQVMNVDTERKERILNPNKNNEMIEFTLDKRINELLQQQNQSQNKFTSSSTDVDKTEIYLPTTFKDISAFFENKALVTSTTNISEQKKMIRAKRRHMPINNNDLTKLEIISSTEKESIIFHPQIKRIKTTHKSEFDSIDEAKLIINDNIPKRSNTKLIKSKVMNNISLKKTLSKQWFILLLLTIIIFLYFSLSNLTNISKDTFRFNPFFYPQNFLPQQSKDPILLFNKNVISRYGQFIRHHFFSSLDLLITFLGQIFFRIEKYEYQNTIVYVATSTYEQISDWFIHLFK